ncbi:MAG: hypothetical protein HQM03_02885 [Magnetococcales bacterium]|nr:hypothetical protein [Magnetococcales bacterium]
MNQAESLRKLAALPAEQQAAVFALVDFLASKTREHSQDAPAALSDWDDGSFSAFSMSQALRGMEEDPVAYDLEDLRERWR